MVGLSLAEATMIFGLVEPKQLPTFEEWVKAKIASSEYENVILYSAEQALARCRTGDMQLWVGLKNRRAKVFMLTELLEYPAGRVVNICLVGGCGIVEFTKIFGEQFWEWCRLQGACMLVAEGSPALVRMLSRFGFVPTAIKMHKPLMRIH